LRSQEGGSWTENAFYFWTYDRPTSMWYYAGTIALPFIVVACCLFPLAPWCVEVLTGGGRGAGVLGQRIHSVKGYVFIMLVD
jgi:hypothetical protein